MGRASLRTIVHAQLLRSQKADKELKKKSLPRAAAFANRIVSNKWYVTVTIILTIYALTAEDIRLLCTDKPSDIYFDCITACTLLFFICDMALLTYGKRDYFLGNMFVLDIVSTSTMLLDFSFIDITGIDKRNIDNFRSARTARLGVRASRVGWAIKQWRCYKAAKALFVAEASFAKELKQIERSAGPGDEVSDAGEPSMEELMKESSVGRKLSELTVYRVIAVVLMFVVFVPLLHLGDESLLDPSAAYGAELVYGAFNKLRSFESESNRVKYDNAMLRQIYTHNWYARVTGCVDAHRSCPSDFYSSVFWFGITGTGSSNETLLNLIRLRNHSIEAFERKSDNTIYDFGSIPAAVRTALASKWSTVCQGSTVGISVLAQKIDNLVSHTIACPEDLRSREWTQYSPRLRSKQGELTDLRIVFYTDDRPYVRQSSVLNLICTGVIVLCLCISSLVIADANNIVLRPLESMMLKVQLIKINPLMAKELAFDALKAEEIASELRSRHSTRFSVANLARNSTQDGLGDMRTRFSRKKLSPDKQAAKMALLPKKTERRPKKEVIPMETRVLENTIIKLGMLLMLGFGEAGVNIIGRNMDSDGKEARAWVNGMARGIKVECLLGFTRIGDFELITEVLQCGIMSFVNKVSEIVHGVVEIFSGCPNQCKNGSFAIIWSTAGLNEKDRGKLTDMAIVSFARIFAAVHSSRVLSSYQKHPGLQQKLLSHCRVNLTSGLHYGWAIEGAVGTEYKIDANYISQNVFVAESVEAACELYGVHFLLTGKVVEHCTPEMAQFPRLIDRVTFDKTITPNSRVVDLYVIDMSGAPVKLEPPLNGQLTASAGISRHRFKFRQALECQKSRKWSANVHMVKYMTKGWGMEAMQRLFTEEFVEVFKMGFYNYFEGEWATARTWLVRSRHLLGFEDGPSVALLELMNSLQPDQAADAPANWKGFHIVEGMKKRSLTYATISRRNKLVESGRMDLVGKIPDVTEKVSKAKKFIKGKSLLNGAKQIDSLPSGDPLSPSTTPENMDICHEGSISTASCTTNNAGEGVDAPKVHTKSLVRKKSASSKLYKKSLRAAGNESVAEVRDSPTTIGRPGDNFVLTSESEREVPAETSTASTSHPYSKLDSGGAAPSGAAARRKRQVSSQPRPTDSSADTMSSVGSLIDLPSPEPSRSIAASSRPTSRARSASKRQPGRVLVVVDEEAPLERRSSSRRAQTELLPRPGGTLRKSGTDPAVEDAPAAAPSPGSNGGGSPAPNGRPSSGKKVTRWKKSNQTS